MLKFFRRGATFIQGGTSIPESRVCYIFGFWDSKDFKKTLVPFRSTLLDRMDQLSYRWPRLTWGLGQRYTKFALVGLQLKVGGSPTYAKIPRLWVNKPKLW